MNAYRRAVIDITSGCNAKCTWCTTGSSNRAGSSSKHSFMTVESFARGIDYMLNNGIINYNTDIELYNWGEPFLNKNINLICSEIVKRNLRYRLSTNASVFRKISSENLKNLSFFRISLSGFSKETYSVTHQLDFDKVLKNIDEFADMLKEAGKLDVMDISFLTYKFNFHEINTASNFFKSKNISFTPRLAYYNDFQQFNDYINKTLSSELKLESDKQIFNELIEERIKGARENNLDRYFDCPQLSMVVFDVDWNIIPCCRLTSKESLGNLFEVSPESIPTLKSNVKECSECRATCQHYFVHSPTKFLYTIDDPQLDSPKNNDPKLYVDFGEGFSETTAITKGSFDLVSGDFFSEYRFNNAPQKLRFDPLGAMFCVVKHFSVFSDNGEILQIKHNGTDVNGAIFFPTFDSQIVFENKTRSKFFCVKANIVPLNCFSEIAIFSEMISEIAELKEELKCRNEKAKTLSDKIQKMEIRNSELTDSILKSNTLIDDLTERMSNSNNKLTEKILDANNTIQEMNRRCDALANERKVSEQKISELTDIINNLSYENKTIKLQNEQYHEQVEREYRAKEAALMVAVDESEQKSLKAEREIHDLKNNLNQYKSAANYYKAEASLHFNSFRYRIGTAITEACKSPKKFVKLPFVMIGILKEYKRTEKKLSEQNNQSSASSVSVNKDTSTLPARTINAESSVGVVEDIGSFTLREYRFSDFEKKYDEIKRNGVDIIIPIYNAYEELCECLDTLYKNTNFPYNLVLINDCSPDERIAPLLEKYNKRENVTVYNNEFNLGFVRTVNFGITHTQNNVVFLNSDTMLTPHWLRKLVIAGCSCDNTATVTPFSNAAGAFSVPEIGKNEDIPDGFALEEISALVERNSKLDYVHVPTGNGFCMYVTRKALDTVGILDYEAFSRGYGEENDFCMRAKNAGFCNLICDDTYVYHKRSASFKEEKLELIKNNRKILDERYPEYSREISVFKNDNRLISNRFRIGDAIKNNDGLAYKSKRILYVLHEGGGGTTKTNEDLMGFVSNQHEEVYMLTSNTAEFKLYSMINGQLHLIYKWKLITKWDINNFFCDEYKNIYFDVVQNFHIQLVHIRHLFKHSFDIVYVAEKLNVPVILSLHDFYFICPTINLINSDGEYCAGECRDCDKKCRNISPIIKVNGDSNKWTQEVWRRATVDIMGKCNTLITTSEYSREIFVKIFPEMANKFKVIEHGRDFNYERFFRGEIPGKNKIRILLAGNIDYNKGEEYIISLIRTDKKKLLEFHCIGSVTESLRQYVTYHGKYRREEFVDFVDKIKPSFVGIFSIWPETYCHVLTEAWSCGIPCIVSDIGTLKERGEKHGGCVLANLNKPSEAYEKVLDAAYDTNKYQKLVKEALAAEICSVFKMGIQYSLIYDEAVCFKKRPAIFWICENTPKHVASTHIRVISPIIKNDVLRKNAIVIRVFKAADIPILNERKACIVVQRDKIDDISIGLLSCMKDSRADIKIIFEIDDDLMSMSSDHIEYKAYETTIYKVSKIAEIADVIFTPSRLIADRFGEKCIIFPNYIDERLWTIKDIECNRDNKQINVVYTGSATHQQDLSILKEVMEFLNNRLDPLGIIAELNIVGCTNDNEQWYTKIPVPDECKEYPKFAVWVNNLGSFDIAVAPLDLENRFNHAKSCLKYLEYSSMGVPGVYTDIEPYRTTVNNGVTGFLIAENDIDQWVECLYNLCVNPELRGRIAHNAQNDLRANYLLREHFEEIANEVLK